MLNNAPRRRYEFAKLKAPTGCEFEQLLEADSAFIEGVAKTNKAVTLEQYGLENVRSL